MRLSHNRGGIRSLIFVLSLTMAAPVLAMTYFLQSDLGINGFERHCRYSNGEVYSVNSSELCPMSIEVDGLDFGNAVTGFKAGEYDDGMTKVCVYDVLGSQRAVRVGLVELCPLTYDF